MIRTATFIAAALMGMAAGAAHAQVVYYGSPVVAPAVTAVPVLPAPVVAAPVFASPVIASPVITSPVVAAPVMASPVVAAPVVSYAAAPAVQSFYQVKKGGRLETVAKRTGVSLADLIRLNPALSPQGKLPAGTLVGLPIP